MATYISHATGNLTDVATWANIEAGAGSQQLTASTGTDITDAYQWSAAFTGTNLDICDGLLLHGKRGTSDGQTITVCLSNDAGVSETRTVVVNSADLPLYESKIFFKFSSPLTLDGGSDYKIGIKYTGGSGAPTFYRDGTAANWFRVLRLTSNAASVIAATVFYIVGELTGPGTNNPLSVHMDSEVNTDYGAITLGNLGTFDIPATGAKNWYLKTSGDFTVWCGATISFVPHSTSTLVIELDCTSNVQYGLLFKDGSTITITGASKTYWNCLLTVDANIGEVSLTSNVSTGWKSGDLISIAPTGVTWTEGEQRTLSGDAVGTNIPIDALVYNHSGTTPVQAEVINLIRSVRIQGASTANQTYILVGAAVTIDFDWVEFKWIGSNTSGKNGISLYIGAGYTNSFSYCSFHDFIGSTNCTVFNLNCAVLGILVIEYCAFSYIYGNFIFPSNQVATGHIYNGNIFLNGLHSSQSVVQLTSTSTYPFTFTNNVVAGCYGVSIGGNADVSITISNNLLHSNRTYGITMSGPSNFILDNNKIYRNNNGINISGTTGRGPNNSIVQNCIFLGNVVTGFITSSSGATRSLRFTSCSFDGEVAYPTSYGVQLSQATGKLVFENCTFGSTIPHTISDIVMNQSSGNNKCDVDIILYNCLLNSPVEVSGQSTMGSNSIVSSQRNDQQKGIHKYWKRYGSGDPDTTAGLYRTFSPSERLTPLATGGGLVPSSTKKCRVRDATKVTPWVYVRASLAADGTAYTGNNPRLMLRRHICAGVSADTVLATMPNSYMPGGANEGEWALLTAEIPNAVTDDAILEFFVDCGSLAAVTGWINISDWGVR